MRNSTLKITLVAAAMICAARMNAQTGGKFGYGTKFGIGQSNLRVGGYDPESNLMFTVGMATSYKFTDHLGVSLDVMGTSKGAKIRGTEPGGIGYPEHKYTDKYNFVDIEIPVMVKAYLGGEKLSFNFMFGGAINFNLLALESRTFDDGDWNNQYGTDPKQMPGIKTTNKALTFGLGATAKSGENNFYFIELRSTLGLNSSLGTIKGANAYHNALHINLGYLFY